MEYEERIKILNWPTLEKRRHFISLIECYKIVFGLNSLKFTSFELALDKIKGHDLTTLLNKAWKMQGLTLWIFILYSHSERME